MGRNLDIWWVKPCLYFMETVWLCNALPPSFFFFFCRSRERSLFAFFCRCKTMEVKIDQEDKDISFSNTDTNGNNTCFWQTWSVVKKKKMMSSMITWTHAWNRKWACAALQPCWNTVRRYTCWSFYSREERERERKKQISGCLYVACGHVRWLRDSPVQDTAVQWALSRSAHVLIQEGGHGGAGQFPAYIWLRPATTMFLIILTLSLALNWLWL